MNMSNRHQSGATLPQGVVGRSRWLTASAGTVMIVSGVWHLLQGIAALLHDNRYTSPSNYTYRFTLTGWGWIYLVMGASILAVGLAVLGGQVWGRVTAILLALLSMAVNFVFLPWYPVWSLLMIALDVAVTSALVVYQRRWNDAALPP